MCFSCFASENGVMLPAPPDSLQTWRPRAIDYRVMCDSLNRVGGMLNRYDIRRNIDLIRSLYPQVENIALVTDNTYGGISLQALVRAEWENYPDLNLVLVDSREGEETAFRTYATLPPRSAVMLGTWRVGSDGEYFMQRSLNDLVQNNPRVPVFSVTGTGIGDTAIGGYVPEYENGAEVIANQIRKYYDTDDIEDAHFHTSKSLYLFDSRKLKEWKIAEYALPKGSVIEDTMAAKLSKYSHYIELLVAGILLLVLLLLFVTWLLLRMRRLKLTLEEREGQLVVAREKAEESDMLKSAFLANMSHEIRTPLNAIVGFSSLMQSEELSQEERAEYCAIVVSNSEMLLTLLNDILDISSLECGKIRFNYASEDIVQICQHVMMTTAHTRQRGVEGRFACPVGSFMLTTDAHRLSQILINLLTNAAKFTAKGSIRFGYRTEGSRLRFYVSDTGCGIPPEGQRRIFDRFVKLNSFKQSTGLGLPICKSIVEHLGGEIGVKSEEGRGTTFWFTLPYVTGKPCETPCGEIPTVSVEKDKLTILIAEDNDSNYRLFETILRRDYRLIHARDGEQAVELCRTEHPHLILMDINMPVMNGYEAAAEIRKFAAEIPIVAVTAYAYASDEQKIMQNGFTGYMPKPINAPQLKKQILDILRERITLI